jgi:protein O-mannosyl-transferase
MSDAAGEHRLRRALRIAAAVVIAVAIGAIYAPVRDAGFFALDDDVRVIASAPLAAASHRLDVSLFGLTPAGPHVVNVALHAMNAALLLALLLRTTGALVPSLVVTALFALHPLRVEAVAWIAARTDVLSALFALATLHAWVSWVRAPSRLSWLAVVAGSVLAMATSPMLAMLPLLLLCLDWWPLGRSGTTVRELVREKLPLALIAGGAVVATLVATGTRGAVAALDHLPGRLAHATPACVWYVWKSVWPTGLAVFYPTPAWSAWHIAGATALVAATAAAAVRVRHTAPWVTAGLVWFAIGLVPAILLVHGGGRAMADRFTYLPSIGLLVAVVWTAHVAVRGAAARRVLAGAAVVALVALAVAAHRQAGLWRTSEGMLVHTLAVTGDNARIEEALGSVLAHEGRHAEAHAHFARALALEPVSGGAAYGLGRTLEALGRTDEAVARYREAVRLDPQHWRAHDAVGSDRLRRGEFEAALHHFSEAVRGNPRARDTIERLRATLVAGGLSDAHADGYVRTLVTWSAAIASDRTSVSGAAYADRLAIALRGPMRECEPRDGEPPRPPFRLYVQVDESGTLTAVAAIPPTADARCIRAGLRTTHAPRPPFAPFHASVVVSSEAEGSILVPHLAEVEARDVVERD